MPAFGLTDNDGVDVGNKYVTKEYLMDNYTGFNTNIVQSGLFLSGDGGQGQLGDNSLITKSSPVTTSGGGTNWRTVAGGYLFAAAVKNDGTLWTWGDSAYGKLGNNSPAAFRSSPGTTSGAGTTWANVICGREFMLSIKSDGTLWSWGRNDVGQLGTGTTVDRSSPQTTVGAGNDWIKVAAGTDHSLGLKSSGLLYSWGEGLYGALGSNATTNRSSPVTVLGSSTTTPWVAISAGLGSSAAIKSDGTLWTWGGNAFGQLGNNSTTNRSSPVTVASGGTTWKKVSTGFESQFMVAIKTDGTLWGWGSGYGGVTGNNTTVNRSSPVTTSGGGTTWNSISAGYYCTTAIKTDGTLWGWGYNVFGGLGNNSTANASSPINIVSGNSWKYVASGNLFNAFIREEGDW
jgi:alpha-tubulin suppressor-like RCC1 family protein